MITKTETEKLRRLIRRLVKAEVADSWKGGQMPEDWPAIEYELRAARHALNAYLFRLGIQINEQYHAEA